jgi:glycine/D-amino acid oxidase-like deaminating enzyme
VTEDGLPLIGKIRQLEGTYVATGNNVWGILNAPATGEALAELIADGIMRTTDLRPFDPTRLRRLDPSRLRSS